MVVVIAAVVVMCCCGGTGEASQTIFLVDLVPGLGHRHIKSICLKTQKKKKEGGS